MNTIVREQPFEASKNFSVMIAGQPVKVMGCHLNVIHHWREEVAASGVDPDDETTPNPLAELREWLEAEGEEIPSAFDGEPNADFIVYNILHNFDNAKLVELFAAMDANQLEGANG